MARSVKTLCGSQQSFAVSIGVAVVARRLSKVSRRARFVSASPLLMHLSPSRKQFALRIGYLVGRRDLRACGRERSVGHRLLLLGERVLEGRSGQLGTPF